MWPAAGTSSRPATLLCTGPGTLRGYPGEELPIEHSIAGTSLRSAQSRTGHTRQVEGRPLPSILRSLSITRPIQWGNCLSNHMTKARLLALSIVAGSWDKDSLTSRLSRALDGGPPDPRRLSARLLFFFDGSSPPSRQRLISFFQKDKELRQVWDESKDPLGQSILLDPPPMGPLPEGLITFPLPPLATWKDLRLWLGLSDRELAWFADVEERQRKVTEPKLHHYRYRWITKTSGRRLIEIPKSRLKAIQRQILSDLLNRVPPHPCAHGFRRHHSSLTYVTPHLGKEVVMRMDLKDFFHSVPVPRIGALFRRLGYPPSVARSLQGLCTSAVSPQLADAPYREIPWEMRRRLQHKHLPQGTPTSPAIANLCAWHLDCRLKGVAEGFGLDYTRYADDLAFSGSRDLVRLAPFLQGLVGAVAREEGFAINHRKNRLNTSAQCQRLAGIVVNERPNLPRAEYDRLKAILHNCARFGPESQNRQGIADFRAHLAGKIAYVAWLNPSRGERLKNLWQRIRWPT